MAMDLSGRPQARAAGLVGFRGPLTAPAPTARAAAAADLGELRRAVADLSGDERAFAEVLNLTANENTLSRAARAALLSPLGDRYYVGIWGDKEQAPEEPYYVDEGLLVKAMPAVSRLERLAARLAGEMFHAAYCDFRPLSGMHAVSSVVTIATDPEDLIYIFPPKTLGHHATQTLLKTMKRNVGFLPWDPVRMTVDLEKLRELVKAAPPKAVLLDYGSPFYPLPTQAIRDIVGPDTLIIYDGSHVLGLIAGGKFSDPLRQGCDILIGNTHKTFPGPQKGMILFKDAALGKRIADVINVTTVSTQQTHQTLALFIAILEMSVHGRDYAAQIVRNSKALSAALGEAGFTLLEAQGRPSETHMVVIEGPFADHHAACGALQRVGLNANSKGILGRGVIRLGVQEVTRRGMKEEEMRDLAGIMKDSLLGGRPEAELRARSRALARRFSGLQYTLDAELDRP